MKDKFMLLYGFICAEKIAQAYLDNEKLNLTCVLQITLYWEMCFVVIISYFKHFWFHSLIEKEEKTVLNTRIIMH